MFVKFVGVPVVVPVVPVDVDDGGGGGGGDVSDENGLFRLSLF